MNPLTTARQERRNLIRELSKTKLLLLEKRDASDSLALNHYYRDMYNAACSLQRQLGEIELRALGESDIIQSTHSNFSVHTARLTELVRNGLAEAEHREQLTTTIDSISGIVTDLYQRYTSVREIISS